MPQKPPRARRPWLNPGQYCPPRKSRREGETSSLAGESSSSGKNIKSLSSIETTLGFRGDRLGEGSSSSSTRQQQPEEYNLWTSWTPFRSIGGSPLQNETPQLEFSFFMVSPLDCVGAVEKGKSKREWYSSNNDTTINYNNEIVPRGSSIDHHYSIVPQNLSPAANFSVWPNHFQQLRVTEEQQYLLNLYGLGMSRFCCSSGLHQEQQWAGPGYNISTHGPTSSGYYRNNMVGWAQQYQTSSVNSSTRWRTKSPFFHSIPTFEMSKR